MTLTLDAHELREVCGLARNATLLAVQKRLCELGIPFRAAGGKVLVSRAAAEQWLACGAAPRPAAGGVRLDLVKR